VIESSPPLTIITESFITILFFCKFTKKIVFDFTNPSKISIFADRNIITLQIIKNK
jgi:hypothetical protein